MGRKDLGRLAPLFRIPKSCIRIVLDKSRPIRIGARNIPLYRKPRRPLSIWKLHRIGPNKANGLRWIPLIKHFRPIIRLILQANIIAHCRLGLLTRIHPPINLITLGDIIGGAGPAIGMEAMIAGRLGRRGKLLHAITKAHGSMRERRFFEFANRILRGPVAVAITILHRSIRVGVVQVSNHTLGRNGVQPKFTPYILLQHRLGRRISQHIIDSSTRVDGWRFSLCRHSYCI
mmetsp:Transcript_18235/g.33045  ORF Transcript_18235/g.33045 Transcript_18235/m.33045 type:complete len:232 (-) Transcript_18235:106-801(-)